MIMYDSNIDRKEMKSTVFIVIMSKNIVMIIKINSIFNEFIK